MKRSFKIVVVMASLGVGIAACAKQSTEPEAITQFASLSPAGGAVGVDPGVRVVIDFSHAMMAGMEQYVALHERDVNGPIVAGAWVWNAERTRLSFTPAQRLRSQAIYTVHIGGGLRDAAGHAMGFQQHGQHMGGSWAGQTMMAGNAGMMGPGWRHANGSFGMIFIFTTA